MSEKQLRGKIVGLLRSLVFLSDEERQEFLKHFPQMGLSELQKSLSIFEEMAEKQKDFLKNVYRKDPNFSQKFHVFSAAQLRRLHAEAFYLQGRAILRDLLQQKTLWRKPL